MRERTVKCAQCGLIFTTSHPRAACCSRKCTIRHNNAIQNAKRYVQRRELSCPQCGEPFIAPRSDSKFCSVGCMRRFVYAQSKEPKELTCKWCSATFVTSGRKDQLYCSDKCQQARAYAKFAEDRRAYSRRWNAENGRDPKFRPTARAKFNRRRALMAGSGGAGVSASDWVAILSRARGSCFYCGEQAALTMDHVIPLSRGGDHSIGNVVAACGSCNYSKSGSLVMEWRIRKMRASRLAG